VATHIDAGATLLNGGTAPARQVMLGMSDATFDFLTPDGQQLFAQSIGQETFPSRLPPDFSASPKSNWNIEGERQAAGIRVAKTVEFTRAERKEPRRQNLNEHASFKKQGLNAPEIANALNISERTVFRYLANP
jgi:hypothetical protein